MLAVNSFFKRHKKLLIILAIVIVVIIVALVLFFSKGMSKPTFAMSREEYTVDSGDITSSITGSGTIASSNTKTISAEVSADVLSVNYAVGDKVSKGDILFELDKSDYESKIRNHEKTISSLSKSVNSYKEEINGLNVYASCDGYVSNFNYKVGDSINKNSNILSIISNSYYYLTNTFYYNSSVDIKVGDTAKVFLSGTFSYLNGTVEYISDRKVISSEGTPTVEVKIKIENPGYTLEGVSALATIYTDTAALQAISYEDIKADDAAYIKAKASGTVATTKVSNGTYVYAGQLLMTIENDDLYDNYSDAVSSLSNAYEDLADTKETYDFYTITSPIDGVITSLSVSEGDYVRAESSLATVVNNNLVEFSISVDELDILDVEIGQEVKVTIDALEETEVTPLIGYVSEIAVEGSSMNSVTTYPVTISLSGDENIKLGFNCSAEIIVSSAKDVVRVPVDAINSRKNTYFVTMQDNTQKEVSVGLYNEDYIEITDGLSVGDVILLPEKVQGSTSTENEEAEAGSFNFSDIMGGTGGGGMPTGGGMPGGGMSRGGGGMPGGF